MIDFLYRILVDPFVQMGAAPDLLVQTLWERLVGGVLCGLIARGFVLSFKASGVLNFAQGIMMVFAALTVVGLHDKGVPAFVALGLTIAVMYAQAVGVERVVLRPLVNQPPIILFMATFGLHIYLDAGFGKEPIPFLNQLAADYGFAAKFYPVASAEMQNQSAQWLNVGRDKPDYMIMYGWGAINPTAIKEAVKIGYPMDKFVSIWWPGEENAKAGGGGAKGFKTLNWHAVGGNFPVVDDIRKFVADKGRGLAAKEKIGEVLYNRGIYNSMPIAEAIATGQKVSGEKVVGGEDVRRGLENINLDAARLKALGMEGFAGLLKLTCADHNGHLPTFVQQWDGKGWTKVSDLITQPGEKVMPLLEADAKAYAEKNAP